ncbi:MAG: hypothetical protein Q4C98_00210 [Capnocytophaga sp.]|nr:hypothetical protein [Capnocytophaga sp.]
MLRFFLFFLICFSLKAQSLENIRNAYITASSSEEKALHFYEFMEKSTSENPIVSAYVGASQMIYAKYAKKKAELLKSGKNLIENAITNQPNDIEIRLIRLSVQENLPKIIPYRKNINDDKNFILKHIDKQPLTMQKYIGNYVKKSNVFSEEEKERFVK